MSQQLSAKYDARSRHSRICGNEFCKFGVVGESAARIKTKQQHSVSLSSENDAGH
jgi:hypothetical protein